MYHIRRSQVLFLVLDCGSPPSAVAGVIRQLSDEEIAWKGGGTLCPGLKFGCELKQGDLRSETVR